MIYIIGSGIAGLSAAISLKMSNYPVTVITKRVQGGSSYESRGGIAAATAPNDSPELHAQDTIAVGDGLCDVKSVDYFTREALEAIETLEKWGFEFDKDLRLEAGHSRRRVHHRMDSTGMFLTNFLLKLATKLGINIVEDRVMALKVRGNVVKGFITTGGVSIDDADSVILATGGYAYLWSYTSNPRDNTGDGVALAFRAGAVVGDLEFVQFHPTVTVIDGESFLLTETLRGEGAVLINDKGERFAFKYHEKGELAPRDVLSRAIYNEYRLGRRVYMDLKPIDNFEIKFPSVNEFLRRHGLTRNDLIPVVPGAHYSIGGVRVNIRGESTIRGLYAIGEVANTGLHGANRLASNSLLEALVMGINMPLHIGEDWEGPDLNDGEVLNVKLPSGSREMGLEEIRRLNWDYLGIIRDGDELSRLISIYEDVYLTGIDEWSNAALISYLTAKAALMRKESRGSHYRADYPSRDDARFRRRIYFRMMDHD
ncbi:L-aspartate oxidase [Caldivirga maquilingensis]|uniref:L-aspartate oxidase n=1 Tax=Caldivirga maquilingensis (strain ATCC 700844 / DSM 13496 / JCM 10307 / IC-167) TaxID=397948 RepID=A8MAY7_CALMQ|nr:FAD-dependent oxidoreductase [Caldivirga maquilingensis]ABW02616.1 L-aspartate oxidase [Caldivirga maquilingensis IC-167]